MHVEGTLVFEADREATWAVVTDPQAVLGCVPQAAGMQVRVVDETHVEVAGRVGPRFLSFPAFATVEVADRQAPASLRIVVRGQAAGNTLDATAVVTLADGERPGTTAVAWSADGSITGSFASMAEPRLEQEAPGAIARVAACLATRVQAG